MYLRGLCWAYKGKRREKEKEKGRKKMEKSKKTGEEKKETGKENSNEWFLGQLKCPLAL